MFVEKKIGFKTGKVLKIDWNWREINKSGRNRFFNYQFFQFSINIKFWEIDWISQNWFWKFWLNQHLTTVFYCPSFSWGGGARKISDSKKRIRKEKIFHLVSYLFSLAQNNLFFVSHGGSDRPISASTGA